MNFLMNNFPQENEPTTMRRKKKIDLELAPHVFKKGMSENPAIPSKKSKVESKETGNF